jgi:NADPH:quinone reductase-like Zn-dependent oxidoreductase
MAVGRESLVAAGLALPDSSCGAHSASFSAAVAPSFAGITSRRSTHADEFEADMATLFQLLRANVLHPVVIDRLPLAAAEVHARIDRGRLGGKIVRLPWSA